MSIIEEIYDERQSELDELRTNISGFYGNPPDRKKRKTYREPALQDDYKDKNKELKEPVSDSENDFEDIEEISSMGGGSAAGYSLPLGMKPKYFKSKTPKVKGMKIYNRKKKK